MCWLTLAISGFAGTPTESLLAVRVNGREISSFEPVLENDGHYHLSAAFFAESRISLPDVTPLHYAGREYYPLDAIAGLTFSIDQAQQILDIRVPSSRFTASLLDGSHRETYKVTETQPGAFLNHDMQYLATPGGYQFSGLFEAGVFTNLGVLTSRFESSTGTAGGRLTRLDTQFLHDFTDRMATLVIGDSLTSGEMWGRSVYFTGVRYASKFETQPAFIPMALPGLSGEAVQPSVVDIYVDNVKRLSQRVDAGPFAIRNIPVMSGQGEISMVVTDPLGRSQTVTQSFVRSTDLLRKGVNSFSYEAGTFRTNYGIQSNGYKSFFAAGSQRRGITDALTIGFRGEITPGRETAGVSSDYGIRRLGIIGGGAVLSMDGKQPGHLLYAHFDHAARSFAYSVAYERASSEFRQLGLLATEQRGRQVLQATVSRALGRRGTLSAGALRQDLYGYGHIKAITAGAGFKIGPAYLSVTPTYATFPKRSLGINFALVIPVGHQTTVLTTANVGNDHPSAITEIQKSLPLGTGYGYRVRTDALDNGRLDAGFFWQNQQGRWGVETSRDGKSTSWRLSETAGLAWMHGHLIETQWLNSSFALVEVPNQPNVEVLVNNQRVARTNKKGVALVPWLVPYDHNTIRLDDRTVSMNTILDIGGKTIVPMPRSGVFVGFTPEASEGATLILNTPTGELMPLGAKVYVNGDPQGEVAFHGEVFLRSLKAPAHVRVEWPGHTCELIVETIPDEILPRIGPLTCKGMK